tara:strand:+ start:112 stop:507 length:396 start_codon:yes stop_codon:yes gene_type:complete
MEKVQDSGKVWLKGSSQPVHAIRAENKIFATGKEESQGIKCWVDRDADLICIDLHNPEKEIRIARKFPIDLKPTIMGTLFNGFAETKHADVHIISSAQDGVEMRTISGETYKTGQFALMNSFLFWDTVWEE